LFEFRNKIIKKSRKKKSILLNQHRFSIEKHGKIFSGCRLYQVKQRRMSHFDGFKW